MNTDLREDNLLTWTYNDMVGVYAPNYSLDIITAQIILQQIPIIQVDKGSSSSILFPNCFEKMGLP